MPDPAASTRQSPTALSEAEIDALRPYYVVGDQPAGLVQRLLATLDEANGRIEQLEGICEDYGWKEIDAARAKIGLAPAAESDDVHSATEPLVGSTSLLIEKLKTERDAAIERAVLAEQRAEQGWNAFRQASDGGGVLITRLREASEQLAAEGQARERAESERDGALLALGSSQNEAHMWWEVAIERRDALAAATERELALREALGMIYSKYTAAMDNVVLLSVQEELRILEAFAATSTTAQGTERNRI